MGLVAYEIEIIAGLAKQLPKPFHALSLGHPDILATPEELKDLFGKLLPIDNEGVRASRKNRPDPGIIGAASIVFKEMGANLTVIDKRPLYGVNGLVDLDFQQDGRRNYAYDMIVDPGTTEHCFNVGQAIKNVAEMLAVGGVVYHMVPMASWNHGFWNFSPTAFADFYGTDNGFEVLRLQAVKKRQWIDVGRVKAFDVANNGRKLNLLCIARKTHAVDAITFPLQGKYH